MVKAKRKARKIMVGRPYACAHGPSVTPRTDPPPPAPGAQPVAAVLDEHAPAAGPLRDEHLDDPRAATAEVELGGQRPVPAALGLERPPRDPRRRGDDRVPGAPVEVQHDAAPARALV